MGGFLTTTVIVLTFVVFLGYFNERTTKFTYEISLMFFSVIIGGILLIIGTIFIGSESIQQLLERIQIFNLESFLMDGVLCFMLFAGSCHMRLLDFQKHARIISLMATELFGAILVGIIVTAVCFPVFRKTSDETRQIFTSLLAVAAAYLLYEHFGFSGAIASVVCVVLFSALRNYAANKGTPMKLDEFDLFWHILDTLLNSALYVILGLSFIKILQMKHVLILSVIAIIANLIGRSGSLAGAVLFAGKLPDGYSKGSFIKLFTWGGLRGGLAVALAMSTQSMVSSDIYYIILGGTYAIVFFTTIVQGMTMPQIYKRIQKKL